MAAKASSSNYNSFQFFQQQQQQSGAKPRLNNENVENTQDVNDLHLKMSKKIAQLTKVYLKKYLFFKCQIIIYYKNKVIYSLNSKNDEYESMISFLKNQFDQEREQLMQETSKKLEEYKNRIVSNSDQSKQIAKLDSIIKDFGSQK
jgi:hypothetical protein